MTTQSFAFSPRPHESDLSAGIRTSSQKNSINSLHLFRARKVGLGLSSFVLKIAPSPRF